GVEPVPDTVDDEHPGGALPLGRRYRALTHDARAENQDGVALADLGETSAEPAGRQHIGDHERLFVGDAGGNPDEGVGRVRDARGLRLQPVHRSGRLGAAEEAGARLGAVRVGRVALGGVAAAAVGTVTAGNGGTHDHAITRRETAYRRT